MLAVIAIGVEFDAQGQCSLSAQAQQALQQAELVIGSTRQLASVASLLKPTQQQQALASPFSQVKNQIQQALEQDLKVAVLASGDPLFYGIGAFLGRSFADYQPRFFPHISSVQAAFAQLGFAWQDASVVSLHGRPASQLQRHLGRNKLLAVLTDQQSQPEAIAKGLIAAGFPDSQLWVCEALGYPEQRISHAQASDLSSLPSDINPLQVTVIKVLGTGNIIPEFAGINDADFIIEANGRSLLSKQEVRLCAIAQLQLAQGEIAWDIGAGCGGLAVELALSQRLAKVYALEPFADRFDCLEANRDKFGVGENLICHAAKAPEALAELPAADAIFVGGSGGDLSEILQLCWQALKPHGRLVISCVTEGSKLTTAAFIEQQVLEASWTQIAISRSEKLAGQLLIRPQLPVTLVKLVKPAEI